MKNIKLNQIAENRLNEKEMNAINGGYTVYCSSASGKIKCCGCGCYYEGQPGGSTTSANKNANYQGELYS